MPEARPRGMPGFPPRPLGWPPRPADMAGLGAPCPSCPYPFPCGMRPPVIPGAMPSLGSVMQQLAKEELRRAPRPPRPQRQSVMSVTQLEAQMLAEQQPPSPPPRQKLSLNPQIPMAQPSRSQRPIPPVIGPTAPMPPGLAGPPPPPPPARPLHAEEVYEKKEIEVLEEPELPEAPCRIVPFTERHRQAALKDESNPMLEHFRKSQADQRQHVGLMTSSDKELIVRIQLGQLAAIGEVDRKDKEKDDHHEPQPSGEPEEPLVDGHEALAEEHHDGDFSSDVRTSAQSMESLLDFISSC